MNLSALGSPVRRRCRLVLQVISRNPDHAGARGCLHWAKNRAHQMDKVWRCVHEKSDLKQGVTQCFLNLTKRPRSLITRHPVTRRRQLRGRQPGSCVTAAPHQFADWRWHSGRFPSRLTTAQPPTTAQTLATAASLVKTGAQTKSESRSHPCAQGCPSRRS